MSDKALGATLPHSWDPHQNFQSSREELWQPMGYLTGLRASGSSVNKRGGGAAGAHSPSSSQGSPSPREQAERQRAETASQQECRRFLEDWMDPSSTQARSFTVEASASGTQSDVFFHREPGRQARAQRVRHLADDGSFTGRTIFVASPITARASTAFTNSPARRRPAIGVPKSRRELSRALNGGLEPRAQLGPFSPGRQHTNRESAQARRSLRPRMDLRIGTSGRAGGSLTGGAAERHQRDGGRVSWWREGDDVVSGRTEGSWAVPKAAAVRGVQLGRRSAYGRQSVPLPQSSSVDDIAVRVIHRPPLHHQISIGAPPFRSTPFCRDDACDPSHPGHRLEGARAVLGAHHAVPLQAVNLHPAFPGPPDFQGARGAPPPPPNTRHPLPAAAPVAGIRLCQYPGRL
eukprot:COSAG01_NODE_1669_length_9561_cov_12.004122_1_plen_405_part_00